MDLVHDIDILSFDFEFLRNNKNRIEKVFFYLLSEKKIESLYKGFSPVWRC